MPRLLSLNSYHYRRGGADMVYLEHDALFRSMGWQTAFMAMHHPSNQPSEWDAYFVDELQYGHSYGTLSKAAMALKVIYSVEARRKLAALLDAFRPDIAHSHNLYHHLSPSVLPLLKERGIPTVLTAHDLKLACPAHTMLAHDGICERCRGGNFMHAVKHRCVKNQLGVSALVALESWLHRVSGIYRKNLDRIVVPSRFYRDKFVEWGWAAQQLEYLPNFVKVDEFSPRYEPGRYFVYFGRLSYEKGVGTLLRAARLAGMKLVVMGDGELADQVREAQEGGADIDYLGRRSGAALLEVVAGSRGIVLPSEWYENAPMSVLEAFALGKPAIGARIGGIPEMVREGVSGLLFESGNAEDLARAMRTLAEMPDSEVAGLGRSARALVEAEYSLARYRERMLELYSALGADTSPGITSH